MSIKTINPTTNQIKKEFEALSDPALEKKLELSWQEYLKWSKLTIEQRSAHILQLQRALLHKKEELAQLMTLEMGKPITEARAEIEKCAWLCEHYANEAAAMLAPEQVETEAKESYIRFDSIGITFAVMPWNFPFWQVFRQTIPSLLVGNTVVLKHASNVPQCALIMEEVLIAAGLPEGCFQTLLIKHDQTELVLSDPNVKMVSLTGSERAGSSVAALAGKYMKKSILELGGSDPFLVLKDANLERAAEIATAGRFQNNGQSCIAAKRFIVAKEVKDEFTKLFKEKVAALKVGNPADETTNIGPMAREDLAEELLSQIKRSVEAGAKIILGGDRPDRLGAYFNPTLLDNVTPGMPAFDEELFGPAAAIITAENEGHAIELANNSRYGLGSVIFSKDTERAKGIAQHINSGSVFINQLVKSHPKLPFGGVNLSGYGRELSTYGLKEFANIKTVWVD